MSVTHSGILAPSPADERRDSVRARTLPLMAEHASAIHGVWKRDVRAGDWVIVCTRNSRYVLAVQPDGSFVASGGWFERDGGDAQVGVVGCTWGGTAILTTLIAAPGMFVEFTNGVRTTRVRDVRIMPDPQGPGH